MSNEKYIRANEHSVEGDGLFWSLCRLPEEKKVRGCMRCGKSFNSKGRGNRFCNNCVSINEKRMRRLGHEKMF